MGCDGFRVDMAGSLVKNDDDQEGTIALWQDFRKFMDEEFPECALLSEWGEPGHSFKRRIPYGFPSSFRAISLS